MMQRDDRYGTQGEQGWFDKSLEMMPAAVAAASSSGSSIGTCMCI
jgi:hypothetical protein